MAREPARFLSIGELQPDPLWRMPPHAHQHHEMIRVLSGRMLVNLAGQTLEAGRGDVLLYPARVPHQEWTLPSRPVHTYYLAFRGGSLGTRSPLRSFDTRGRIRQMLAWLLEDRHAFPVPRPRGVAPGALHAGHYLHAIINEYQLGLSEPQSPVTHRVRAYIREHLADPITLTDLAGHAGMSRFHFLRRYRQITGRTPMDEVRRLRMEQARDLLVSTSLPLKAIARRVGLANEHHLSRLFRRYHGLPPGQLRHGHA